MKDLQDRSFRKLHWVTAGTARRLVEPYIKDSAVGVADERLEVL